MDSKQVFFAYIKPPNFSGQSASTDLIIQELRKRNWQCNVLPLYPLQRSIDNPIIRWYRFLRGQLLILPKLFGVATARKPVIHISLGQSFMSFTRIAIWLIPILMIRPKCVVIIALNGSTFMGWEKNQLITKYFLLFLKKARVISVLGNRQKNKLKQLGLAESKIQIIHNTSELDTVDLSFLNKKHEENEVNILHLSLLIESKGFPEYLEAALLLANQKFDKKVNVILCGPIAFTSFCSRFTSTEEKINWINTKIQEIRLVENVNFDIKWIKGAKGIQKEKLFNAAHIFVLPTTFPVEAQPLVLLEALSSGVSIITTKVGEIESILDDQTAVLIDKVSSEIIKDEILQLIIDTKKRTHLARNGILLINDKLSLEHYINTWENVFSSALGK